MKDFFTNKFGQKIKIQINYRDAHNVNTDQSLQQEAEGSKSETDVASISGFLSDLFKYAVVFDF